MFAFLRVAVPSIVEEPNLFIAWILHASASVQLVYSFFFYATLVLE